MKKLFIALCTLGLSFSLNTNAITIDLVANNSAINPGDNVEVQVRISGLNDMSAPALGVYDVDFNYDASLFSVSSINWGDSVKGNQLDLLGFGSAQDISSGFDWLRVFELSFDDVLDLESLQAGEFTLFSVLLNAIAIGSGDFSLATHSLGDAYGNDLVIDHINNTQVSVGSVSVPEPSSILLLLLGILAIVTLRFTVSKSGK